MPSEKQSDPTPCLEPSDEALRDHGRTHLGTSEKTGNELWRSPGGLVTTAPRAALRALRKEGEE